MLLSASSVGSTSSDDDAPLASIEAIIAPPRVMEDLDRGVVAVRSSSTQAFISWRLLGLDPGNIGFNLYRAANGGAPQKLNGAPLTGGTNFTDATANLTLNNSYHVRPVLGGVEQPASGSFTLKANTAVEPVVRIPLQTPAAGYTTKFVWVGDLDGDKEYDYVIDRLAPFDPTNNDIGLGNQYLEAYRRDGTRLWQIDMGPNSRNTYNIEPGSTTLSMGMYDGVTVYDLNGDGRAEVVLKVANGVVFPNGSTFTNSDSRRQFLAILDGMTGNMVASTAFPTDFLSDGSLGTQLAVGHVTGPNANIILWGRNRVGNGGFNDVFATYSWSGGATVVQNWKLVRPSGSSSSVGQASHQLRVIDVDGDGRDEIATGTFMINSNGTLRYALAGAVHGDRFYITKMDPSRPGLQGYAIQQNNPNLLLEHYYDATTGEVLWQHFNAPGSSLADVGRGLVGDLDPRYPGYEVWSFSGLYNGPTNTLAEPDPSLRPWPNQTIWWDGDLLAEGLNDSKFEKWDYTNPRPTNSLPRILTSSNYGAVTAGHNPMFMGDILGDWRTEVVELNAAMNQLIIFTTNIPSTTRLYTMPHNPAYRAHMTIKGYMQSPMVDYYLGHGMTTPPRPNIVYAGQLPPSADFDGDQRVDGNDFLVWQRGLGIATGATLAQGDANRDGSVNASDLAFWRDRYGSAESAVAAIVADESAAAPLTDDWTDLAIAVALTNRSDAAATKVNGSLRIRDRALATLVAPSPIGQRHQGALPTDDLWNPAPRKCPATPLEPAAIDADFDAACINLAMPAAFTPGDGK